MLRILFLAPDTNLRTLKESERYAFGWASDLPGLSVRLVSPGGTGDHEADLLWWHASRRLRPGLPELDLVAGEIAEPMWSGVPLLLTGTAISALPSLGLEERPPRMTDGKPYGGPVGEHELRGHMSFTGHPAFSTFGTGVYTWRPAAGVPVWDAWYHRDEDSPRGRPVAVERGYISFDPVKVTALTYDRDTAKVGAIGSHLPFHDRTNPFRGHLERFVEDWIWWLSGKDRAATGERDTGEGERRFVYSGFGTEQRDRAWPVPGAGVVDDVPDPSWDVTDLTRNLPPVGPDTLDAIWPAAADAELVPAPAGGEDPFFDVSGRRHFVTGHARSGIAEAWSGGLRLFRECSTSWTPAGGRTLLLDDPASSWLTSAGLHPGGYTRVLSGGEEAPVTVRQMIAAHGENRSGLTLIEVDSSGGGTIEFELMVDLRLMWPYPAGLLGPLAVSRPGAGIIAVRGQAGEMCGALLLLGPGGGGEWTADEDTAPDPSGGQGISAVRLVGRVDVQGGCRCVLLAWAHGGSGMRAVARALAGTAADPARVVANSRLREEKGSRERVSITTPGSGFGEAFNRAVSGMAPFRFTADSMGTSYLAGFNVTGRDWLSGRPGYAWFFGRDAVFTALSAISAGEFGAAREVLTFLASHQEWTGKILHEATLSGAIHYDAADSTPLWLLLLGAYYRASGDLEAVSELWPAALRALAFCRRTDGDRDGLIENTGVGHGWIEGGSLYGAHVSSYLAGVWAAALDSVADCAEGLGDASGAARLRAEASGVREAFEEIFWVEGPDCGAGCSGNYALGMMLDRTVQSDHTVMPTVPILLGQADTERARAHLVPLAGEAFSTDWGVRMVSRDHRHFDPSGYHHGSVWPLYTGWTALAEYHVHRHEAALAHLQSTLATLPHGSRGNLEEVLHGLEFGPAGVCPHQAWSHAVTVQAVVEGLVGWRPDARPGGVSELSPHIPEDWEALTCEGLRVGRDVLGVEMEGPGGERTWRLTLTSPGGGGERVPIHFSPAIPFEARPGRVRINREGVRTVVTSCRDDRHIELDLELEPDRPVTVEVEYVFDFAPVIKPPALVPGQGSSNWRLVDRWWEGGPDEWGAPPESCRMILEGPPGTEAVIDCLLPGRRPGEVAGAEWVEPPRRGKGRLRVHFPETGEDAGYASTVVLISFS